MSELMDWEDNKECKHYYERLKYYYNLNDIKDDPDNGTFFNMRGFQQDFCGFEIIPLEKKIKTLESKLAIAVEENKILRTQVAFYASKHSWQGLRIMEDTELFKFNCGESSLMGGKTARAALEKINQVENTTIDDD